MTTHTMKLVTIIAEALVRERIEKLLVDAGAHGFTVFNVEGQGAGGRRTGDIGEYANVQIEAVVPPDVAERLLARLEKDYFQRYGLIVYESDVRVVRPKKF